MLSVQEKVRRMEPVSGSVLSEMALEKGQGGAVEAEIAKVKAGGWSVPSKPTFASSTWRALRREYERCSSAPPLRGDCTVPWSAQSRRPSEARTSGPIQQLGDYLHNQSYPQLLAS